MKIKFIVVCILIHLTSTAQNSPVKNLVFEGAGIRGIAYSGAIKELEERNILQGVQRVGGTSAGAITALLLSIGYKAEDITNIINSTSFKKFNDGKFLFFGGINRLKKYYGWYRGQQFEKWLSQLIAAKTGNADISFQQLQQQGFKELYITGTCLNKQSLVIFSHETYPAMKVKDAVRISMSIPFYFEAVFINHEGKVINQPQNKEGLDIMIDGGLIANFPIRMFDSTRYINSIRSNKFAINPETIGFRIDRNEQIENDSNGKGLADMPVNDLKDYVTAFYTVVIENMNRQTLTKEDWDRTISISDGNIAPRIRKLSTMELQTLITNGSASTQKFLAK